MIIKNYTTPVKCYLIEDKNNLTWIGYIVI